MKSTKAAQGSVEANNLSIPTRKKLLKKPSTNWRPPQTPAWREPCNFWRLRATRQLLSYAAKTAAASGAMPWRTHGRRKRTRCASTLSASTEPRWRHVPSAPRARGRAGFRRGRRTGDGDSRRHRCRVKELCAALAEAERGGHAFIALKWFRDSFLPRKAFRWNQHPSRARLCWQRPSSAAS